MKKGNWEAFGNKVITFGGINDHDEIPSNFQKDFIRNSLSKYTLYQYLIERFTDLHSSTIQVPVVIYKDAILKTQNAPDEDINSYKYEEADAHVIRYLISVSKCWMFDFIVVYSTDTNVLLLFLVYHCHCEFKGSTCTVFCNIGLDPSSKIYNVSVNARTIGLDTCQALPFFHAFTGCDTVSSFFNHSKKSMWEAWHKYPNHYILTQIIKTLSGTPEQIYPF